MPAESTLDDVKSVVLEFVDRPARRGRPVTLTVRRFLKICHHVEAGASIPKACEAESVSYRNFRFRVSNSHADCYAAALRMVDGVAQQVVEDLRKPPRIGVDIDGTFGEFDFQRQPLCIRPVPHLIDRCQHTLSKFSSRRSSNVPRLIRATSRRSLTKRATCRVCLFKMSIAPFGGWSVAEINSTLF
jgi:hypothetical protein